MFREVRKRSRKAGAPPGTLIYTGTKKNIKPEIVLLNYSDQAVYEKKGSTLEECLPPEPMTGTTWIDVEGLNDITLLENLAKRYNLHPLTVEDILNVDQRSKVEDFSHYIFIILKVLYWYPKRRQFTIRQFSLVIGQDYVISFQDEPCQLFNMIRERIRNNPAQGLQKKTSDYLAYRLIDTVVDNYFIVLEGLVDQIEKLEDIIIIHPEKQTAKALYRLKRQILMLRKAVWPTRDVVNYLFKLEHNIFSEFTHVYLRDVYDHTVQAIDTIEVFREILSNMLDIYLSSLTNRMNEIIKVLTIIATIFMPVTFIASIYGMNFHYMPELSWKWSYPIVLVVMGTIVVTMLLYFRRKNWW